MQPTEAKQNCPDCGTELAPGGILGLCPVCLMKQGLLISVVDGEALSRAPGQAWTGHSGAERPVAPSMDELRPQFEQLELLELIGQGGMGAVYKVRQKGLGRVAALKILPRELGAGENFARRFTREAQALAKLNHPNIVGIYDFGQTPGGWYYLLMEHVEGVNLRQVLRQGRMAPARALAIVPQICDALKYAHESGVIHRDIKPENILLDRAGAVKIADFGLAKLGADPDALLEDAAQEATITRQGQAMGTPHYMAPEQLEHSHEVDHRADIYSLGVVFYELLTGELPLGRFDPPSSRARLDVRLDEVVLRTLEKEPSRRYQHIGQVKTDVQTIMETDPPEHRSLGHPPTEADREHARKLVKWPARLMGLTGAWNMFFGLLFGVYTLAEQTPGGGPNITGALFFISIFIGGLVSFWAFVSFNAFRRPWVVLSGAMFCMVNPPGLLLGLPAGIWAIEMLHRREVRRCLSDPEWHGRPGGGSGDGGSGNGDKPASVSKGFHFAALPGIAALTVPWYSHSIATTKVMGYETWHGWLVGLACLIAMFSVQSGNSENVMRRIRWKIVSLAGVICLATVGWFIYDLNPPAPPTYFFGAEIRTKAMIAPSDGFDPSRRVDPVLGHAKREAFGPFLATASGLLLLTWGLSGWRRQADDRRMIELAPNPARSPRLDPV